MFKLLIGAAIGAAAAWFLDPNDGARRRNTTRDKAMKYARQGKDQATEQATSATETVKGKAEAVTGQSDRGPAEERLNDQALQAKVESEIFRTEDAPKDRVSVNVENGVVYLRGELDDPAAIEGLREAASKVDGVRGVESLLHAPGEPAPTKETGSRI
jgi:osmotically-inducible protein OsmY